jgi:cytochrome c-type biogenesis protein CcmF
VGVFLLGVICTLAFSEENIATLRPGESANLSSYNLVFEKLETRSASNYDEQAALISIRKAGIEIGHVATSKRFYRVRNFPTTETGLFTQGFSQLYFSLAEIKDNRIVLRLYYKPLVLLIWIGCIMIALGGIFSLTRGIKKQTS